MCTYNCDNDCDIFILFFPRRCRWVCYRLPFQGVFSECVALGYVLRLHGKLFLFSTKGCKPFIYLPEATPWKFYNIPNPINRPERAIYLRISKIIFNIFFIFCYSLVSKLSSYVRFVFFRKLLNCINFRFLFDIDLEYLQH